MSVLRNSSLAPSILWGTVKFPAMPTASNARNTCGSADGSASTATYTASNPNAEQAALCISGESECATGCPTTARTRVLPRIRATL